MSPTGLADISTVQHRTWPPYPSPAVFLGVIPTEALDAVRWLWTVMDWVSLRPSLGEAEMVASRHFFALYSGRSIHSLKPKPVL